MAIGRPAVGAALLRAILTKLPDYTTITPVHAEFARASLLAHVYDERTSSLLDRGVFDVADAGEWGTTVTHVLQYGAFTGALYCGCERWQDALEAFKIVRDAGCMHACVHVRHRACRPPAAWSPSACLAAAPYSCCLPTPAVCLQCFAVPGPGISPLQVDAYKRYLLVGLLGSGGQAESAAASTSPSAPGSDGVTPLPKTVSQHLPMQLKQASEPYHAFCRAFAEGK